MHLSNLQSSNGKVISGAIVVDESYSGKILQFDEGDGSWNDFGRILDNGMVALRSGMPLGKTYKIKIFNGPVLGEIDIGSTASYSDSQSNSYETKSDSSASESSWWAYDEDENFFKTIFLFPIRLPIWIVMLIFGLLFMIISFIFGLVAKIVSVAFQFSWAVIATAIGGAFATFVLGLTLFVGLPLRIVVFILTFGNKILWQDELFDWFGGIMSWIREAWDFD